MTNIKNNTIFKYSSLFFELILYYLLFIVKQVLIFDISSHLLALIFVLVNFIYFYNKSIGKINFKKGELILIIIINLLISFCISGKVIFMNDYIMTTGIKPIIWFIMVNVFIFPFIYNFLYFFDNLNIINKNKNKNNDSLHFSINVFLISFITWFIIAIGFYPGNITVDSVIQLQQATGAVPINGAHPIFSTLYIKWLLLIWNNPFIVVIANVLFFSLVITRIYKYLYEKNVNKNFLYISLIIFILCVNNISMITMIWKDIPFTISLFLLTVELYRIVNDKDEYFKKITNMLILTISLVFTYLFRQNGMFPFIVVILYLAFLTIKSKKKIRIISTIVVSIFLVALVNGPVFNYYNADNSSGYSVAGAGSFAGKGLGALVYYDIDLSESDKELISKMGSFEELKNHYNRYSIDTYSQLEGWNKGLEEIGISNLYGTYIKHFFLNPKVIIRDKLDGCNLLWSYQTPQDGYNYTYDYGVDFTDSVSILRQFKANYFNKYVPKKNIISKPVELYQKVTERVDLINIIFWRFGFALSILLLLLYYVVTKKVKILPVMYPTIISILFWLVLMSHHSYRYLWFMFVNIYFIFIFTLVEKNSKKAERK